MSRQATDYLVANLYEIRLAQFTDSAGTVRSLGENGLALLLYLADAANEKQNQAFFMQTRTMADETGIAERTVKRLLAGFEELGWIMRTGREIRYEGRGRATPEYLLTLVPGVQERHESATKCPPNDSPSVQVDTSTKTKPKRDKASAGFSFSEPEPQPEPQPQPTRHQVATGTEGGKEWGERHSQVYAGCIESERRKTPKGIGAGLMRLLERDYRPLVTDALRDLPGQTNEELVRRCVALRNGEQVRAPAPRCSVCKGNPWVPNPVTGSLERCHVCYPTETHENTQENTRKRVTSDPGTNTDTPAQGAPADPRSVVDDLAGRLRRVV